MEEKRKYIEHYTAEDIERYLNKQMTPAEMHAFEKASLEDPFLAEALEGYTGTPVASIPADIKALKERLEKRDEPVKIIPLYKRISWVAAAAVFILLGATATWIWLKPSAENSIAQKKEARLPVAEQEEKLPAAAPALQDSVPAAKISPKGEDMPQLPVTENTAPAKPKKVQTPVATTPEAAAKTDEITSVTIPLKDITRQEDKPVAKKAEAQTADNFKSRSAVGNAEHVPANRNAAPSLPAYIFKGKITDDKLKPLPFANITIAGAGTYAYTDANGNFTLMSGDTQIVVHVKSVGFKTEDFTLHSGKTANTISLKAQQQDVSDVVVVGYGKETKKKITGSAEKDDEDEPDAEPADGWSNYDLYLLNNERLPQQGYNKLMGSVELSFTVNKYGNVSDFNIESSTCPLCEKEAIRLIREGPKWKLTRGISPKKITVTLQF
ncbi:MAG: carboxypeptidase-like regulatory domain-containing protein [Agriterribacter sp.]